MSTLGHTLTPAVSRLYTREEHRQYQYVGISGTGYIHNWEDPTKLIQHAGGRHAEILTPATWSQPFRGGPAGNVNWYAVDELTAQMQTWYPGTGTFGNEYGQYVFSSPGLGTATIPTAIGTDTFMPLTPYNFGGGTVTDCWVMRKGTWAIDATFTISGTGAYTGPWDLQVGAKAFRDYTLYSGFRDQVIYSTSFTGYGTHAPITVGSPLVETLRHNSLWDVGFKLTPNSNNPPALILDFSFHAIRTAP